MFELESDGVEDLKEYSTYWIQYNERYLTDKSSDLYQGIIGMFLLGTVIKNQRLVRREIQ